jgi:hypothetical protein
MEQGETRSPELVVETGITRRRLFSSSGGLAAGTLLFGTPAIAALTNTAHASPSRGCATPVGFRKLLVYIAEGEGCIYWVPADYQGFCKTTVGRLALNWLELGCQGSCEIPRGPGRKGTSLLRNQLG